MLVTERGTFRIVTDHPIENASLLDHEMENASLLRHLPFHFNMNVFAI